MFSASPPPPGPLGTPAHENREPQPDRPMRRRLIDAAAALGLLLALGLVFLFGRGSAVTAGRKPTKASSVEVIQSEVAAPATNTRTSLRLAVTTPPWKNFDDMGGLLDSLGAGYHYTPISLDDLLDANRLSKFDVVFAACASAPREWMERRLRKAERANTAVFAAKPEIVDRLRESLRNFVSQGGTLYASDYQFDLLRIAFDDLVDPSKVGSGGKQTLQADVVDSGLKKRLGPTIQLLFDKSGWRPAAFTGSEVTTYLQGTYRLLDGQRQTGPLLVTFPVERGMVVFTSFHNNAQSSEVEKELLRYLVFTTITAREEARIAQTMVHGGLSPQERNLLSASSDAQPVSDTYLSTKGGHLQFVLGFEERGARLRLEVVGPDGRKQEKAGGKTIAIDIAEAKPGPWKYTITPVTVPYTNFPFTLTIGENR